MIDGDRKLHILPDVKSLNAAVTEYIETLAEDAVRRRGRFLFCLSGGRSPRPIYAALAVSARASRILGGKTDFFWSDERAVPPDHPDSNYRMTEEALLKPLAVAAGRIHRIRGELPNLDAAALAYEHDVAGVLGAEPDGERFDLMLLGLGDDAHTASLFPNTAALREENRLAVANPVPQLQVKRITMTAPLLNRSRKILFLASGASKAAAVSAVLCGPRDPQRFPAQLVRSADGPVEWFLDAAAAAQLDR